MPVPHHSIFFASCRPTNSVRALKGYTHHYTNWDYVVAYPPGEVLVSESRVVGQVMVECPGFATVKFDRPSGLCSAEFSAAETTVECLPGDGGTYTVFPGRRRGRGAGDAASGACLRIDADGTAVYYAARRDDACDSEYYVLRHSADVVVETVDSNGYHYVVTAAGDNHVGLYRHHHHHRHHHRHF